jgi:F-type H+-transporting ATPase subunit a
MGDILHSIFKLEVHASLRAEDIAYLGPLAITNSMLMSWAAVILLSVVGYFAGRNPQEIPRGLQNFFEAVLETLLTVVETTAGHYARRVFPLVATLFIFIITANYMGLLPGVGTILIRNPKLHQEATTKHAFAGVAEASGLGAGVHAGEPSAAAPAPAAKAAKAAKAEEKHEPEYIPLLRAANADVNQTFGMGLIAFFFIHASGVIVHGLTGYWKNDLANPPMMAPVKIIIEMFVPVSLSMRLFGNIFGGEMLLTVMAFPIVAVPFMVMELLFGFIQAVIFSMLTLIFTSLASHLPAGHAGHEPEGAAEAHGGTGLPAEAAPAGAQAAHA